MCKICVSFCEDASCSVIAIVFELGREVEGKEQTGRMYSFWNVRDCEHIDLVKRIRVFVSWFR